MLLWSGNGASSAINVVLLTFLTLYCTNALVGILIVADGVCGGGILFFVQTNNPNKKVYAGDQIYPTVIDKRI